MKKLIYIFLIAIFPVSSFSAGDSKKPKQMQWQFDGAMGSFDRASIQRGFQVYREVCASCHGVKRLYFRNLTEIGFSEAEAKQIASEYTVIDGPDDSGDLFERPARLSDAVPSPFPNKQAAMASNGGAYPPDLSLMVKARVDGANYLYSLLTGYMDVPEGKEIPEGKYYNDYYPGNAISMAPPLGDDLVTYQDDTKSTVEQQSKDIVNFLQWAAEPEMEHRKQMGLKVSIFLIIFTILFIFAKKRAWARIGQ